MSQPPLYTLSKLANITGHKKDVMDRFNKLFLEQTVAKDLPKLMACAESGNVSGVFQAVHRMKTSVDIYCIESIRQPLKALESVSRSGENTAAIPALASQVQTGLLAVAQDMRNHYARPHDH